MGRKRQNSVREATKINQGGGGRLIFFSNPPSPKTQVSRGVRVFKDHFQQPPSLHIAVQQGVPSPAWHFSKGVRSRGQYWARSPLPGKSFDDAFSAAVFTTAYYDRSNSRTTGPMTTKLKSIGVDVVVHDIIGYGGQQWSPSYINQRRRKAYKTVKTEDNGFTGGLAAFQQAVP